MAASVHASAHADASCTLSGLRLRAGDDLWLETAPVSSAGSVLVERREAARHRMEISFNDIDLHVDLGSAPVEAATPGSDFTRSVRIDGRQTIANLKAAIAHSLGVPAQTLRLRRSAKGAHLKGEAACPVGSGPGGAGFTDGAAVFVEQGQA